MSFLRSPKGFTVIEVMVALLILAVVLVPLLNLVDYYSQANVRARRELTALNLAQAKLESLKNAGTVTDGETGDLGGNYSYKVETIDTSGNRITVRVRIYFNLTRQVAVLVGEVPKK